MKAKPGNETFISSVLKARMEAADNAATMKDCCIRLQAHNRKLKEYVAVYDCQTIKGAVDEAGWFSGANDRKLIAALFTRTKSQLQRTKSSTATCTTRICARR